MSEAPKEITINGEVYVRKDSFKPNTKYMEQGLYPVIMKTTGKKLVARCYDPSSPRFVIDGIYTESDVLYEHSFSWIGELCSGIWDTGDVAYLDDRWQRVE